MVQFARSLGDGHEHALKFFVSPNAFDRERRLYGDPTLGVLLPRLGRVCTNADGAITDAFGEPLPPFIVMEKGEALDEWSRRAKPDLFQSVAVRLSHAWDTCMTGEGTVYKQLSGMHVEHA